MAWEKRQMVAVVSIGMVLAALVGGSYIAQNQGRIEPPSLAPIPAATPAAPIQLAAGASPEATPKASSTPASAPLTSLSVFVSGEVKKPGVYHLKPGDRIQDAIHAAGGFTAKAQTDVLNLADYARDADQYSVPARVPSPPSGNIAPKMSHPALVRGSSSAAADPMTKSVSEPTRASPPASGRVLGKPSVVAVSTETAANTAISPATTSDTSSSPHHSGGNASGKFHAPGDGIVNLNTATLADLQKLPGVGPSTAQHILDYRDQHQRFADISQIQDVKGIGPKKFEKMKPFLTVE